jgi:hypothetical protein
LHPTWRPVKQESGEDVVGMFVIFAAGGTRDKNAHQNASGRLRDGDEQRHGLNEIYIYIDFFC